jgi:hypothetical protein
MTRESWSVVEQVSRAVAERAITEREACVEVWARTGRDPRSVVRAIREGVRRLAEIDRRSVRPARRN